MEQFNNPEELRKSLNEINDPYWRSLRFQSQIITKVISERVKKGWTQELLAQKAGLKQSAVARFESFDHEPKLSTIERLFDALDLCFEIKNKEDDSNTETIDMEKIEYKHQKRTNYVVLPFSTPLPQSRLVASSF